MSLLKEIPYEKISIYSVPLIRLEQALPLPEASKFLGDIMEAEMVETGIKLPKLVKDRFNRVEEEIVILNGKLIG